MDLAVLAIALLSAAACGAFFASARPPPPHEHSHAHHVDAEGRLSTLAPPAILRSRTAAAWPLFGDKELEPRAECTDENLVFQFNNGTRVPRTQIMPAMAALPPGDMVSVTALGMCGGFTVPATPMMLRTHQSSDAAVMELIFLKDELSWLDQVFPDRYAVQRIIDLGSNCGMSLLAFSTLYPNAKIVGVEPELHNFGMISLNVGQRPNIFVQRAAIGARLQLDELYAVASGSWGFGVRPLGDHAVKEDSVFPTLTVPHLLSKYALPDVDLLKVDVEGSELELCEDILAGARWVERIKCISFELHDRFFPDLKPEDKITRTCVEAMTKADMYDLGVFGELRCFCRMDANLQAEWDKKRPKPAPLAL